MKMEDIEKLSGKGKSTFYFRACVAFNTSLSQKGISAEIL